MSNTSVFIKNILDSTEVDTISVLNSISIIDLNNQTQLGGKVDSNILSSDSSLITTNDFIEYGKKKKSKKAKKQSLFKTRKVNEEDSSDSDSMSSDTSSFEDSMDSTSISSDVYPLFNYYGSDKKKSKSQSGGARKILGSRILKTTNLIGGGDTEMVKIGNEKPFVEKKGALHDHLKVPESYRFSKSTLDKLAKIPIGDSFTFKRNEITMTRKLKAEIGLAKAFITMRKDKKRDKHY
ncbi:hypothetical protein CPAV1605_647 [seawater metagenome]|uniref:Uncharacterized protein n=1 Tax=seawater metagenome TaxID=1561972 RepID=A0A5E8CLS4_9ZZZZ